MLQIQLLSIYFINRPCVEFRQFELAGLPRLQFYQTTETVRTGIIKDELTALGKIAAMREFSPLIDAARTLRILV